MQTTLNQRIKIYCAFKNVSQRDVAAAMGVSLNTVSGIFTGQNVPRISTLNKFFEAYPDLNRTWLMEGEGEMIKTPGRFKESKKTGYVTEEAFELLSNEVQLLRQSITKLMGRLENFPPSPLKTGKKLDLNLIQGVYSGDVTYKQSA
jgi:transcriptional regulator with XRE-family HTH domain